jgi:hypothetical protein
MMWSKRSRRIDPISRSTKPFCQGEAGAIGLSRMPMARNRRVLIANGVSEWAARNTAGSGRGPWYLARSRAISAWALKCILQITRPAILVPIVLAQLLEPPCTDPYARWWGRGGAARLPPIPIAATLCVGTKRSWRRSHRMSVVWGEAEDIRSGSVFRTLTQMYGPAVRCKWFRRAGGERSCINVSGL